MLPLKNLTNYWRTLEMPLNNCEINIILTFSKKCIIVTGTGDNKEPKFEITDTKLYVPNVTLSAQDNEKLLQQLKTALKKQLNGVKINQTQHYRRETKI